MPNKVFVGTVVSRTEDEERTQRYRVFEVSELGAEKALLSYLRDRDENIISLRIRELTRSEAASLNLSSGKVKLLDLATLRHGNVHAHRYRTARTGGLRP